MKSLLFILSIVTFFSCSKPKKTTYKVTDISARVPVDIKTWTFGPDQWVKKVVYSDSVLKEWKLNSNGDTIWTEKTVTDSFYYLKTMDTNLPFKDSTGKQVVDPNTHTPVFYLSWAHPLAVPSDVVNEGKPIPSRFLPQLYSSIPSPDTTSHIPKSDTTKIKAK